MDYKKAGVDIEAGYKSVELMKKHVKETMRRGSSWRTWRIFRSIFSETRSRRWKIRYCYPVQTDAVPK